MTQPKRPYRRPYTFKEKVRVCISSFMRTPGKFLDLGCVVLGALFMLLMLSAGFRGLTSSLLLVRQGISTTGTITSRSQQSRYSITYDVLFETSNGNEIDLSTTTSSWSTYFVGDTVPVLYNPSNPHAAKIATFFNIWATPAALLLVGGIIGFFSLGTIVRLLRGGRFKEPLRGRSS